MQKKVLSIEYYPLYLYIFVGLIVLVVSSGVIYLHMLIFHMKEKIESMEKTTLQFIELINVLNNKISILESKNFEHISPNISYISSYSLNSDIFKYISILLCILLLIYLGYGIYAFFSKSYLALLIKYVNSKIVFLISSAFPLTKTLDFTDKKTGYFFKLLLRNDTGTCDILVKRPGDVFYRPFIDFCSELRATNFESLIDIVQTISDSASLSPGVIETASNVTPVLSRFSDLVFY